MTFSLFSSYSLLALTVLLTATSVIPAVADEGVPLPMIYSAITKTVDPIYQPLRPYESHGLSNVSIKSPAKDNSGVVPLAMVAVAPLSKPVSTSKTSVPKAASKPTVKSSAKPVIATKVPAVKNLAGVTLPITASMKAQPFLAVPVALAASQTLPEQYTTASSVLTSLQQSSSASVHVEALRRAAHSLPPAQYTALINGVQQRFSQQPSSALRQLDWGYTKLVFEHNKAGLFYMRKANDELNSPVAALCYGLAQAAVDTLVEKAPVQEMTIRKLDVMHKLDDALVMHAKRPVVGFWPTYRGAMNQLALVPAYADWVSTDRSETLVPTGDSVALAYNLLSMAGPSAPNRELSSSEASLATCQRQRFNDSVQQSKGWAPKDAIKTLGVSVDGNPATAYVFQMGELQAPATLVLTQNDAVLATVTSKRVPYVLEDIDHDATPEIVVRQFLTEDTTPPLGAMVTQPVTLSETPLQVYRYNGCQYALDETVAALFE